jgi:hypothetical protein
MMRATTVRHCLAGLAAAAALAWGAAASAATCGIIGSATASGGTYDPFSPTGFPTATVALRLQRINGAGGQKTDIVNFYLKSNSTAADGTSIIPSSVVVDGNVTGLGLDIFYDFNQTPPNYAPTSVNPSSANQYLKIEFTGNNAASDFATVNFQVTLPANLDLNASTTLPFDAVFACSTTGGGGPTQQTGSITTAVTFPITVLSALQATYGGAPLDFGEIGDKTTAQVTASPATYVTAPTNYVRVQSSGPYEIALTSANNYYMTPGGAATTADPLQRVGYKLKFLGATRLPSNTAAISTICPRAGVGTAAEDHLNIQGQLAEGGAGKVVSANYRDTLTVTITPKAATTSTTSGGECAGLSGQF